jgi:hypothetical protein
VHQPGTGRWDGRKGLARLLDTIDDIIRGERLVLELGRIGSGVRCPLGCYKFVATKRGSEWRFSRFVPHLDTAAPE